MRMVHMSITTFNLLTADILHEMGDDREIIIDCPGVGKLHVERTGNGFLVNPVEGPLDDHAFRVAIYPGDECEWAQNGGPEDHVLVPEKYFYMDGVAMCVRFPD